MYHYSSHSTFIYTINCSGITFTINLRKLHLVGINSSLACGIYCKIIEYLNQLFGLFLEMEKIIQLIVFCQFVLVIGLPFNPSSSSNYNFSPYQRCLTEQATFISPLLDSLKLKITRESDLVSRVNLIQIKRVLANENLPVWILERKNSNTFSLNEENYALTQNYEVMNQLGQFTIYQEPESSSAAVYFHKRREFDGMIGYELLIQKLSVDNLDPIKETLVAVGQFGIYDKPNFSKHNDNENVGLNDSVAGVNDQKKLKTYGDHIYKGYPEILVIVSWDLASDWTRDVEMVDYYTKIVSQVLTLFNGIDMLYSKLVKTKIQINIAGIIIAYDELSLKFLRRCYHRIRTEIGAVGYKIDAICINTLVQEFLKSNVKKISLDSYDIAIFLTREHLSRNILDDNQMSRRVLGVASNYDDIYQLRKLGKELILIGSVTSRGYLDNYVTIAHEMAHLMTVRHDLSTTFLKKGKCYGHLMKTIGDYCNNCLTWSENSEETFKLFFSSPNCCKFINKPRSLKTPGPQFFLTADKQCECYGYKSARKIRRVSNQFCDEALQCVKEKDQFEEVISPMDGTPCFKQRVCWQKQCSKLASPETTLPRSLQWLRNLLFAIPSTRVIYSNNIWEG